MSRATQISGTAAKREGRCESSHVHPSGTCPWGSVSFCRVLYIPHQMQLSSSFIYLFLHGLLCFC